MDRPTSLYLDLVRFAAALVVFLSHAAGSKFSGGLFWQLIQFGGEAVVIFFALSGFVIGYVVEHKDKGPREYALNRTARIYSVAVPALILTFALDAAGQAIDGTKYSNISGFGSTSHTWQLLNAIFFTSQFWHSSIAPGTNGPYWSLGFEIWYYVAFGLLTFASRRAAIIGIAALALLVGPKIAFLFPMWASGLLAYRVCARRPPGAVTGFSLWALSSVLLATLLLLPLRHHKLYDFPQPTPDFVAGHLYYYGVAAAFCLNVVGFRGASALFAPWLERFTGVIRWCGARTFALYLLHMPLLHFMVAIGPGPAGGWINRVLIFIGVPLLCFALATVTEQQKDAWRRGLERLSACLLRRLPAG